MNDYISRQAAIGIAYPFDDNERNLIDALEELPTADVRENVRGEWLHISDGYCDFLKCSQCGKTTDSQSNFCPNCGADMRGEENG